MNDAEYLQLKTSIHRFTKIDLNCYKEGQMRRRLEGHIANQGKTVESYCQTLRGDPSLLDKLRDFLTINVTEFYRDGDQFDYLRSAILPQMLKASPRLNIWSAGCSIGAEPYTVAMTLEELMPGSQHRIVATDLDSGALAKAAAGGPYASSEIRLLPRVLLLKHMRSDNGKFWVKDQIRSRVEFRQHNLLSDSFETGFDLIMCRNVVIYFSDETKRVLDAKFARSLNAGGWLFVGGSESMHSSKEIGFQRVQGSFYQKTGVPAASTPQAFSIR